MIELNDPTEWGRFFGLAIAPLFDGDDRAPQGQHCVLLDGGHGTFALSLDCGEIWREGAPAAWTWSSDIAHHVTITPEKVAVLRWDRPAEARTYSRTSVERGLERFYEYLRDDRVRSNKTVVEHLLNFFRRVRALAHEAALPDDRTTDIFACTLARLMLSEDVALVPEVFGLSADSLEFSARVDQRALRIAIDEIQRSQATISALNLYPDLAVRHAGGLLFQEAHFELLRGPSGADLFGLIGVPEVNSISRGGAHFTPPALARSIVEQALAALPDLLTRQALTVCDPACGSGAFLHESLRALRRSGFNGRLKLIGHDVSAPAIAMARFVLAAAVRDWRPVGGIEIELTAGDTLGDLGMPAADVIVMNPPFIAFGEQTPLQREQLRLAAVSDTARGDYSMAFIISALEALADGGVLGTLFPASLLSLKAAGIWRERLLEAGQIRLLGSIGEFGLFAHAQVQVACAVLTKSKPPVREFLALVTGNDSAATGAALRQLRKLGPGLPSLPEMGADWSLFPVPTASLTERSTWRLPTPRSERLMRALQDAHLPMVADLFDVVQGVQTGLNDALLLTMDEWNQLPKKERAFFRPASMSDSIQNGRIEKPYRVFFPHSSSGKIFETEEDVRKAVPTYFRLFLAPNSERLKARATIVQSRRTDWWGLMRPRDYAFNQSPRLISKFFAAEGGFVADVDASFLPVMGHAWLPKETLADSEDELPLTDIIYAYAALLNSPIFIRLLALYAPHVSGGQFDVSSRHVSPVSIPNLRIASIEPTRGRWVKDLSACGRAMKILDAQWRMQTSELVESLYGMPGLGQL